jgi:hypothetical protein
MSQFPRFNVTVRASPQLKLLGCLGGLVAIFVAGGILGLLLFGWKTLLGM